MLDALWIPMNPEPLKSHPGKPPLTTETRCSRTVRLASLTPTLMRCAWQVLFFGCEKRVFQGSQVWRGSEIKWWEARNSGDLYIPFYHRERSYLRSYFWLWFWSKWLLWLQKWYCLVTRTDIYTCTYTSIWLSIQTNIRRWCCFIMFVLRYSGSRKIQFDEPARWNLCLAQFRMLHFSGFLRFGVWMVCFWGSKYLLTRCLEAWDNVLFRNVFRFRDSYDSCFGERNEIESASS